MKNTHYLLFTMIFVASSLIGIGILQVTTMGQTPPVDGVCGALNGQTLNSYMVNAGGQVFQNTNPSLYCSEGLLDDYVTSGDHVNSYTTQLSIDTNRRCKSANGGNDATCSYTHTAAFNPNGANYNFSNACGSANNQSFTSTKAVLGDYLSNINNSFIGNLCTNSGTASIPGYFKEDALGRERYCPTSYATGFFNSNVISCRAYRYQNAACGIAANTGQSSIPSNNLCSPGTVAGPVTFDNQSNLRGWTCYGNGGANSASCSAWLNGPNTLAPTCNSSVIQPSNVSYPYYHITSFPGSNACIYGTISNWQISGGGTGTWQCSNNGQTSNVCGNVQVINATINAGDTCNSLINSRSFDNSYQLFQNSLCTNGGLPSSFSTQTDRRRRTCGVQSCEALMTTKSMCGRATQQPWRSHPTNGVCTQGIASTIKQSNGEWGWICTTNTTNLQEFNNSTCTNLSCILNVLDFYNGKTAVCTAPRIVDGQCKRQTQINTLGYTLPDDVLQAGLCDGGVPDTLIPTQDFVTGKRKRTCKAANPQGIDSPVCYAKVRLPSLPVTYIPQIINGKVTSVVAALTGFNSIYITFDNPTNQHFKLFTQNGYFYFQYHDRAGNTGTSLAVVENIQDDLPTATVIYSPSTPTSGFVTVSLTGFNRPQIPTTTFTGACLTSSTAYGTGCTANYGIHPNLFTVTFRDNLTGTFTLVDAAGVSNTIPIAVTNIDRTPPTASIQYSNPYPTNTGIIAKLVNPSEPITVVNNSGSLEHYLGNNGSFTFTIRDLAGNTSSIVASVNRINLNAPSASVIYSTTGITQNNVVATLSNFSTSGTIVTNNSGQISYLFTHNSEFIFLLKDPAGNVGSVVAKVQNIDKPVAAGIITDYTNKLCPQRTPSPIDTQAQIYNYHIQTVINNCIMKTQKAKNNYRYFNPRRSISRGEFITAVGRMIKLTTQYSGSLVNTLSPNYLGLTFSGIDESTMGEADARGLLIYSPLQKKNGKRTTDFKKTITADEAKLILRDALRIINNDTEIRYLIKNKGNLSKAQAAYALGTILSQYNNTALGNNHVFITELNKKLVKLNGPAEKRKYAIDVIKKVQKTPSKSLTKLGIDPETILQDLNAIALGTPIARKAPVIIDLQTTIDELIRSNKSPQLPTNNSDKVYNNNFFNFWEGL